MAINQIERAFRAWPILVENAFNQSTITYGELGKLLGIHHRAIRYVLSVIQDLCLETGLPPLTILIVNASGKPGTGFIAYDLDYFDEGLNEVFSHDWKNVDNPFSFSNSGESYDSLVKTLTNEPDSSEEVFTRIKSRGIKQIIFREALLKAYSRKCAFTEITFLEGLEACHIIPWNHTNNSEKLDIRNGILLNSFHHKLFDAGYITISTDYRIIYYDRKLKDRSYSEFDKKLTSMLHGKFIHLPFRLKHRPSIEYIQKHHVLAGWEESELKI